MATGQSKLLSKETNSVWVIHEGKVRQTKSLGIRKRRTIKPGYVVEFRLPNSPTKEKIWAGTFDSRPKAMRAFDVSMHLVGKEPYYYVYPENYFPTRPSEMPSKETVQREAEVYAKKPDEFPVNPSSLCSDTSTSAPPGSPILRVGSHQPTAMPIQREASNEVLEANVELEEVETKVAPAYMRRLSASNTTAVAAVLEQIPPDFFIHLSVFPYIEGEELSLEDYLGGAGSDLPVASDDFVPVEECISLMMESDLDIDV